MVKLTKAPETKINWGMQDPENEKEVVDLQNQRAKLDQKLFDMAKGLK